MAGMWRWVVTQPAPKHATAIRLSLASARKRTLAGSADEFHHHELRAHEQRSTELWRALQAAVVAHARGVHYEETHVQPFGERPPLRRAAQDRARPPGRHH